MSNEFRYSAQYREDTNEFVSLNACYCGHPVGTPTPDALFEGDLLELAFSTPMQTVHVGTIMQDAIEGSMPEVME